MDVIVEDAGPCRKVLQIRAPAEQVAGTYAETLKEFVSVARLPGFRKGKAPVRVVESRYAKEIVENAKDRAVPELYREALRQKGIQPVAVVEVKDVHFSRDSGLDFSVIVDVAPEFKLPKYHQIPVDNQTKPVGDAEVEASLNNLRERLARFEGITDRVSQATDLLRIDYDATCDGQPLQGVAAANRQLVEGRDFLLYLGEPEFLPGFVAGLTGVAVDAAKELDVTFPAEHREPAVAGRTVHYTVRVKEVRQRVLPEWTAEILGMLGVESEAALRERVQADMQAAAVSEEARRRKDVIARHLLEQADFDLPQSVVDQETRQAVRSMVDEISQRGATREQIVQQQESIVSAANRSSGARVKLSYLLDRIADEEQIVVESADVEARLQALATRYQMPVERLRGELEKRGGMGGVHRDLRSEKTMDFLLKEARIAD